jgi:hypothetical protein
MNGPVAAFASHGGKLYAGGFFTNAGGVSANNIAVWNGAAWSSLGSGMNGGVYALTVYDTTLVAGGSFTQAGGKVSAYLAQWILPEASCPILVSGDVNVSGSITSADIIGLVNYVFKSGVSPLPCAAAGDINCNGTVTSSDVISLVNFVFKGGAAPCDVCALVPSTWPCP